MFVYASLIMQTVENLRIKMDLNAHDLSLSLSSQGYDDGYGGEYDDDSYEAYEDNYSNQSKR